MNPHTLNFIMQVAEAYGVSRRHLFQAAAVHRYGCPELVAAAHEGLLAMKHCKTVAKALPHDEQREFLAELPSMTNSQRHERLAAVRAMLTRRHTAGVKGGG